MHAEIAHRWAERLRSGRHQQGKGSLVQRPLAQDKTCFYCCLGVLCEMAAEAHMVVDHGWNGERFVVAVKVYGEKQEHGVLTREVMEWAGIKTETAVLPNKDRLVTLNDSGSTFEEIADTIEKFVEEL